MDRAVDHWRLDHKLCTGDKTVHEQVDLDHQRWYLTTFDFSSVVI